MDGSTRGADAGAAMSLDFPLCNRCDGYVIEGTLKRTGLTLSSRCRCDDQDWERELEAELRERSAILDLEPKELPNGRFQVAA
jgi:hypothetical protein